MVTTRSMSKRILNESTNSSINKSTNSSTNSSINKSTNSSTNSSTNKSTNNNIELKIIIDFDEASKVWRTNKKSIGNGCFKYVCNQITKSGKPCDRLCEIESLYCDSHLLSNHKY